MKPFLIFISAVLVVSCTGCEDSYENDFYERVTGIKFPKDYQVLETFDNGEHHGSRLKDRQPGFTKICTLKSFRYGGEIAGPECDE